MLSGIFFYNEQGDMILGRFYKSDMSKLIVDAFRTKILLPRKFDKPIQLIDGFSFLFLRCEGIYVVGATKANGNANLIFQFLYDIVEIFRSYFDGKFDEQSFRQNFTLIYELLDEVMDNGFPQITSADILQEYIKTTSKDISLRARLQRLKLNKENSTFQSPDSNNKNNNGDIVGRAMNEITAAITGRMDWRPNTNYNYNKNEVYLDVLENVNLLMSRNGEILQMSASGRVVMKTMLSGMPEARIGINDKLCIKNSNNANKTNTTNSSKYISLNDIKLHRCVRLGQFDEDRSIHFVPPDGEFELMRYSVSNLSLPFYVYPNIVEKGCPTTRIVYDIKLESKFNPSMYSTDICVFIPTPENTNKCNIKVNHGKINYEPTKHCLVWKIKKLYGGKSALMKGEVILTRLMVDKQWARPPIKMSFEVRMLAASGMKIRYLKITEKKLGYKTAKWVRYITNAGCYQIRI
mmetsp:Transcript_29826/g.26374  ORF Transcript_29826/g.26374 Transcript_29826/m.26374 type:complete len:464 (-) Transcript_29826:70-1461(-)